MSSIKKEITLDNINTTFSKLANDEETDMKIIDTSVKWGPYARILKDNHLTFERMYSSGNRFDCLIHSFFNATCPNFRKLSQVNKDNFADNYRRKYFLKGTQKTQAYQRLNDVRKEECLKRINNTEYLEDTEVTALCQLFSVKIIIFEKLTQVGSYYSCVLFGLSSVHNIKKNAYNDPVYILYNPGQGHFEAVRNANTGEYSIPYGLAERISKASINSKNAASPCKYNIGDKVTYQGKIYFIVNRKTEGNKCTTYGLTVIKENADEIRRLYMQANDFEAQGKMKEAQENRDTANILEDGYEQIQINSKLV